MCAQAIPKSAPSATHGSLVAPSVEGVRIAARPEHQGSSNLDTFSEGSTLPLAVCFIGGRTRRHLRIENVVFNRRRRSRVIFRLSY